MIARGEGLRLRAVVFGGAAGAIVLVLILNIAWPIRTETYEEQDWPWIGGLMAFPVAAALVLIHRPDNRVGWALGLTSLSAGLIFLGGWYAATFEGAPLSRMVEILSAIPVIGQFAGMVALLYLFPTGHCASPWYGKALVVFNGLLAVAGTLLLLSPTDLPITGRPNPLGVLPGWLGSIGDNGLIILFPFALIGVVSLIVRWRRARPLERSQLKWFLAGAVFALAILVLANILPDDSGTNVVDVVGGGVVVLAFWSLPAAIVIAVLRYRLYDIDRVVSRTLVYALLTGGLVATYFGLVVGLQGLLRPVSGGSDIAIVLTTLVVAALFLPARRRVQDAVDRRFNRRTYDAARTIEAFSTRLREQIDLDTLRYELLAVVGETMQPAITSLWLRKTKEASP